MEETVRTRLKRAWVEQLLREYHSICWQYGVNLSTPIIFLTDSTSYWGQWDGRLRVIRISCDLIEKYPWDMVVHVLKHEMAHQFVTEILRGDDGHGLPFQRACAILGVAESFRGASGDLPQNSQSGNVSSLSGEKIKYLDKVKKLLSLARSSNEHEALLAMEKANALMEKYNIERPDGSEKRRIVYHIINHRRRRLDRHHARICTILNDFFYVETIFSSLYDAHDNMVYRTIELIGTEENVEIAEYVHGFLLHHLDFHWQRHKKTSRKSGREKGSFYDGLLQGFREKLQTQERRRRSASFDGNSRVGKTLGAVILGRDTELAAFFKERHPRVCRTRGGRTMYYKDSWEAGMDAGEKLVLHHGLKADEKNTGFGGYIEK